jgi:hypothetical protein
MKINLDKNYGTKKSPIKCIIVEKCLTYGHCVNMKNMKELLNIIVDIPNFRSEAEVQWLLFINNYYFKDGRVFDNIKDPTLLLKYDWLSKEIVLNPGFLKLNDIRRKIYVNAIKHFPNMFNILINDRTKDKIISKTKTKFMEDNGVIPESILDIEF